MIQLGPNPKQWPEPFKSRYADRLRKSRSHSKKYTKYQSDPHGYAEDVLQLTLTDPQSEILDSVRDNRFTLVKASHAVGKCVAASEFIPLSNGTRVRAGDLIGKKFRVLTLVDGIPRAVKARAIINAIEPVFALTTESGRRAVRNQEHPFMAAKAVFKAGQHPKIGKFAWMPLGRLSIGDVVAVPPLLSGFELADAPVIPESDLKLLAYLIGDGGYTRLGVTFTQQENAQLAEFRDLCAARGTVLKRNGDDPYTYRVVGTSSRMSKSKSPSGVTSHRYNPVAALLREHGLMGKHSRDKNVPNTVFRQRQEQLKIFLS